MATAYFAPGFDPGDMPDGVLADYLQEPGVAVGIGPIDLVGWTPRSVELHMAAGARDAVGPTAEGRRGPLLVAYERMGVHLSRDASFARRLRGASGERRLGFETHRPLLPVEEAPAPVVST